MFKEAVERANARIKSKRGYLRYLKNRLDDPSPLWTEIKRHEEHIAEHQQRIEQIEATLADMPEALVKAEEGLAKLVTARVTLDLPEATLIQSEMDRQAAIVNALIGATK